MILACHPTELVLKREHSFPGRYSDSVQSQLSLVTPCLSSRVSVDHVLYSLPDECLCLVPCLIGVSCASSAPIERCCTSGASAFPQKCVVLASSFLLVLAKLVPVSAGSRILSLHVCPLLPATGARLCSPISAQPSLCRISVSHPSAPLAVASVSPPPIFCRSSITPIMLKHPGTRANLAVTPVSFSYQSTFVHLHTPIPCLCPVLRRCLLGLPWPNSYSDFVFLRPCIWRLWLSKG